MRGKIGEIQFKAQGGAEMRQSEADRTRGEGVRLGVRGG